MVVLGGGAVSYKRGTPVAGDGHDEVVLELVDDGHYRVTSLIRNCPPSRTTVGP